MAYNVDGLTPYVKENEGVILKDIVFGGVYGDTIPLMAKQLGVKTSERIHPSVIDAQLQDVEGCGFNAQGGLNISERTITTHQKKVNMDFCPETLLGKFAEYKVRVGADGEALPFEAEIIEGVVKSINKQVEAGVWQDLLYAEGVGLEQATGATAYDKIMEAYMKIDESILDDAIIFVRPALFRQFVAELVAKNLYHFNPKDGDLEEIYLPATPVRVRKARGINEDVIFATSPKNMIYGTDFLANKEEVKVWFSDDDDVYKLKVRFNYGAQVAFPDLVVKMGYDA